MNKYVVYFSLNSLNEPSALKQFNRQIDLVMFLIRNFSVCRTRTTRIATFKLVESHAGGEKIS